MTAPLSESRLAEIESVQLGEWMAGEWRTEYVEGDGESAAYYLVKSAEGIALAELPDWAGPIATLLADAHEAVPELLVEVARLRAEVASMEEDSATLRALEAGGVDNWGGYSDALAEADL